MRQRYYSHFTGGHLLMRKSVSLAVLNRHVLELLDVLHTIATRLEKQTADAPEAPRDASPASFPECSMAETAEDPTADAARWQAALARLTAAEMDLFRRIGQGQSNREIAAARFRSIRTIETYRYRIRTKLNLKDPQALAQQAWRYAHRLWGVALAA